MEDGSIPTRTLWVGNIKQEGDVDAIVAQLETVFGKVYFIFVVLLMSKHSNVFFSSFSMEH